MKLNVTVLLSLTALVGCSILVGPAQLTEDCVKTVTWEGTPKGIIKTINGVPTYVTKAKHPRNPKRALLFLTDIFGLPYINNQLLADDFAAHGFDTFLPDYLLGDAVPEPTFPAEFNATAWLARHTEAITMVPLNAAIQGIKRLGYKEFAATGYCFGGLYTTRLSQSNVLKVGTFAHPSALSVPDDFEILLKKSRTPLQVITAEIDNAYPLVAAETVDALLGGGKYGPGYNRTHFPGTEHGFAVRVNLTDPVGRAAKEGAFSAAVDWLKSH